MPYEKQTETLLIVGSYAALCRIYLGEVLDILEVHALDQNGELLGQVLPNVVSIGECQKALDDQNAAADTNADYYTQISALHYSGHINR